MERIRLNYSMKNIPIPPRNTYLKKLIEKTESVIKRMRWKAFFYERKKDHTSTPDEKNSFGFKSRKCPPRIEDLECFETDLLKMINKIEFKKKYNTFQHKLRNDTIKIKNSTKAFIPADQTTNYNELDKKTHDWLLIKSITSTYEKADSNTINVNNNEARKGPLPVHSQIGNRMRSIVLNSVANVHSLHANVRSAIFNNSQCLSFSGRSHANRILG